MGEVKFKWCIFETVWLILYVEVIQIMVNIVNVYNLLFYNTPSPRQELLISLREYNVTDQQRETEGPSDKELLVLVSSQGLY